ncbi:MAG: ThuA domain-containing protein [Verrucomicrobia subdivision 3 bacterium]|nr:ThuA domain-containing protein [Limisphaerales bacterium]
MQSSLPKPTALTVCVRRLSIFHFSFIICLALLLVSGAAAKDCVVYEGQRGPGQGRHIVFLSGDEEYRSEEGLPMLAKLLATRHGFKCTVLFAINPKDGTIDPNTQTNIPGLAALDSADLCVMLLRFRELPDADMKHFVDYVNRGLPLIALRTSTHAFAYSRNKQSPYAKFDWQNKEWPGGFGQQVLGDTWVNHHGDHGKQSTRGIINEEFKSHPILRGVTDIWGPTDVYGIVHLPASAQVLVRGQVLSGMQPTDPPVEGPKNHPLMPLVWLPHYTGEQGKANRMLVTTMGAATDLASAGLRRLLVNACFWAVGLDENLTEPVNVDWVGEYKPTGFGFGKFKPGLKPADLE